MRAAHDSDMKLPLLPSPISAIALVSEPNHQDGGVPGAGAAPTPSEAASPCLEDIGEARFPPSGAVHVSTVAAAGQSLAL